RCRAEGRNGGTGAVKGPALRQSPQMWQSDPLLLILRWESVDGAPLTTEVLQTQAHHLPLGGQVVQGQPRRRRLAVPEAPGDVADVVGVIQDGADDGVRVLPNPRLLFQPLQPGVETHDGCLRGCTCLARSRLLIRSSNSINWTACKLCDRM